MTTIESVRDVISKRFQHVEDLGNGVLRGELVHKDKPYAVTYFDLSDSVVERSQDLTHYQEGLLGARFFSPDNDLRWNSYLYFLAGPKSVANNQFASAKARIEADRHFARKFVLAADDLVRRLDDSAANDSPGPEQIADVGATWAGLLREAALGSLLDQPARRTALEDIASGGAFKAEVLAHVSKATPKKDALATGLLRKLTIGTFRRVNKGQVFAFGDVNLIVGANGTGKTSLLEAIEALYCGRVRRDPDAQFADIVGLIANGHGKLEAVNAPTTVPVLKARNTLWYGRTDFQANAISQGFSRFNFLDTDAAFRLSGDMNPEDIKADLGRLLVGPETAKLWDYLSKLSGDVQTRLRGVADRLPGQRRAVELLTEDVKRLLEAPSVASILVASYRAGLAQLAPSWQLASEGSTLDPGERTGLEGAIRSTILVLSAVRETPVTRQGVEFHVSRLREAVASTKVLRERHDASVEKSRQAQTRMQASRAQQEQLEQWMRVLAAGLPALASGIRLAEGRVASLRSVLRNQPGVTLPPVPAEYSALSIEEAQRAAKQRLETAQEQENAAELALTHSVQLGQSLEALRRELHDAAVAYIQRSGEPEVCPVCKTKHSSPDLMAKLEALVASQGATATESFRRNAQVAREQTVQCRQSVALLASLAGYALVSGAAALATCAELQNSLRGAIADLSAATAELQARRSALSQINLPETDLAGWEGFRDSTVVPLLPPGTDPLNDTAIAVALSAAREKASIEANAAKEAQELAGSLARQLADLVARSLGDQPPTLELTQRVTALERVLRLVEGALLESDRLASSLKLAPDTTFEALQAQLEACLLAFDKAHHALQAESLAKNTLEQKKSELNAAGEALAANTTAHANLLRAAEALASIVEHHSLERATSDAFNSIKDKVSSVFAQIHSPQEYELGDFTNDSLIVRRDNGQRHAVHQVSTGQRAALALSIYLALNDSARTAPPVILIDDPVAHIDDLNALSFLDYLREVTLRSRKQVFFATADIRLAALFQRKFEFLGGERFKRIPLPC